jgi:hypothetical protein
MQTIDPLNYCVVRIHTLFNETEVAKATGFFFGGHVDDKRCLWLVSNWHVFTGRNAQDPTRVLHTEGALPNRIKVAIPSIKGPDDAVQDGVIFLHEKFIELYDGDGGAQWYQHTEKNHVDVAVVNLGSSFDGFLVQAINEAAKQYDMAIEVGNDVYVLGYPLGFSHFVNTPIWKRGSIASEPHAETAESRSKVMIDATTRRGMSGSPVVMRYKTHYVTESGELQACVNATRFVGVYASRPPPMRQPTGDEMEVGLASHEIAYIFKSGCVSDVITKGVKGPRFGELP